LKTGNEVAPVHPLAVGVWHREPGLLQVLDVAEDVVEGFVEVADGGKLTPSSTLGPLCFARLRALRMKPL